MDNIYVVHYDGDGILGEFPTLEKAISFCKKSLQDWNDTAENITDELANGKLRILKTISISYLVEKRFRKDYFENEESMTEEEYEEACEEYGSDDPDSPECWIIDMLDLRSRGES